MTLLRRLFLVGEHVCPWWLAYSFDNPLRRALHRPERLLGPYVSRGMTALDIGCGMGHFSLGLARLVGPEGRVVAVDLQPQMLEVVSRRAGRHGLASRVEVHRCQADSLNLERAADFILTFWMAHEVADLARFMEEVYSLLGDGGTFFLAEPQVHVSLARFEAIAQTAIAAGFRAQATPSVRFSRAVVFKKG